jgi:hypothetical protein
MSDTSIGRDRHENVLIDDISDEALEAAATNKVAGVYTLAACTGLSECPG